MNTLAGWYLWCAYSAAYFAPCMVALARRVNSWGSVIVVNLFLGWTVIGWIVALAMACRSSRRPWTTGVIPAPDGFERAPGNHG